jgi:hemerythrin
MNRDHAAFAEAWRALVAMVDAQAAAPAITNALDELIAHTREHFAEEEQWMQRHGFPPYPVHRAEHERVLADMAAEAAAWHQGGNTAELLTWLTAGVAPWFLDHLRTMDFVTAQFIAAQQAAGA